MVQFDDCGSRLDEREIAQLESTIGRPLAYGYRAFLLAYNGGRPKPNVLDIDGAPFKGSDVHTLFGVHPETQANDLFWSLETYEGCRESQLLPIGYDSFGCIFVLALSPEEYGHVYYFDRVDGEPVPYFVANSFDEFLNKLREPTPEELATDD